MLQLSQEIHAKVFREQGSYSLQLTFEWDSRNKQNMYCACVRERENVERNKANMSRCQWINLGEGYVDVH